MRQRLNQLLTALAFLFLTHHVTAQHFGLPGVQTPVFRNTNVGIPFGYYEYLPLNFDINPNTTKRYPLVIFFGGVGELGNGTTQLVKLLNPQAPAKLIQNGRHFPAIVISAQHSGWFDEPQSKQLYDYLISRYPIDLNRVYVTGLSAGGAATWKFGRAYPDLAAAIVPVCGATQYKSAVPQMRDLPVWAFHNVLDGCGGGGVPSVWTMDNCDQITGTSSVKNVYPSGWAYCHSAGYDVTMHYNGSQWSANSGVQAPTSKMAITMYNQSGHGGWGTVYGSQYMWDWLFAQSRNSAPVNDVVTVDAGSDKQILLPTGSVKIYGSAYSLLGTAISTYLWTKESGPTVSMSGVNTSTLTISNLKTGTYRFKLTATNASGKSASDEVSVTVKSPPLAQAGSDQNFSLPRDTTILYGNGSYDPDGYLVEYDWKLLNSQVTGGQQPDTDTVVTVINVPAYNVQINFTPYRSPSVSGWNNLPGNTFAGTQLSNMKDDQGRSTAMDLELLTNWNGSKGGGKITGNNSGVYPDDVMEGFYWFQNNQQRIRISDLNPATTYSFTFFGSRIGSGLNKTTTYKIGNQQVSLNAAENTSKVVKLNNIQPSANGEVIVELSIPAGGTYGYLNAMEVTAMTSGTQTQTTIVINPGTAGGSTVTDSSEILVNFTPSWLQVSGAWNNMNGNTGSGTALTNMKDKQGVNTDVDLKLLTSWHGSKTGGKITGNNSGVVPDNVLNGLYWFQNNLQRILISDLDPARTYDFTLVGSRTGWGMNKTTVYRIGSTVDSVNAADNTQDAAVLKNITPDQNGEVILEISRGAGSAYGYLNAMIIKSRSSGQAVVKIKNPDQAVTTVTGLQEGTYTFELTVKDNHGYTDKDIVEVVVNSAGALRVKPQQQPEEKQDENMEMNSFVFYPNPARDFLTVEMTIDQQYQVRVFNAAGQEFSPAVQKNGNKAVIDVSQLQTGYYIIQVNGEKDSKAERVFVAPR